MGARGRKKGSVSRSTLRGAPLRPECYGASTTTNEDGPDDWRTYCLGVYKDGIPYVMDRECLRCGAYADNSTPLTRAGCCPAGTYEHHKIMAAPNGAKVGIDRCLADEVAALWDAGVATIGCCCGHGAVDPYIQVSPECCDAMEGLGYARLPEIELDNGDAMGLWCFMPKTPLPQTEAPC